MDRKIKNALISVFYKDGLAPVVQQLKQMGVNIYSTGGTQQFIEAEGVPVIPVEQLTGYPSILGGRVKTLHPLVFGGILGRPGHEKDVEEMKEYRIPAFDLVIVDLYPFQETVATTTDEQQIIEKIDIGGPSMIRGAAKNFNYVTVVASKSDYQPLVQLLQQQSGSITLEQRKNFAALAFRIVAEYDQAIDDYFSGKGNKNVSEKTLRYGENPHQQAVFRGNLDAFFTQLHGKEISYNNLVDIDAAIELIREFNETTFAIIKHTNVCGAASRPQVQEAWKAALAGDPESAFGGVLVSNATINVETAAAINEIFFEVLIAPSYDDAALQLLQSKKNRILLQLKKAAAPALMYKSVLNGELQQDKDTGNYSTWDECGGRPTSESEKADLLFANLLCKHLKSNAIALVKNKQLTGKGCGQTSRVDALRHALEKAKQFNFDLKGAVMASDAFFPFNDCVQMGHEAGITAFIQPGGSIRDKDSIDYCKQHNLAMVLTGLRHFKH